MDAADRKRWVRAVALLGLLYSVVGIAFSAFARWSASNSMRLTWNQLAFLVSTVAFAVHIGYEQFRLRSSPRQTASHVSLAVALGAFGLAVAANIHELGTTSGYRPRMLIAFLAWPLLTAVPAFIVALVVAAGLNLRRGSN